MKNTCFDFADADNIVVKAMPVTIIRNIIDLKLNVEFTGSILIHFMIISVAISATLKLMCERCMEVDNKKRKYNRTLSLMEGLLIASIETIITESEVKISGITWLTVHDKPVNIDKTAMVKMITPT